MTSKKGKYFNYISLYDDIYNKDSNEIKIVGEKDFFEFMKRANRDLTGNQRYNLLNLTIELVRKGE
jgi:hypothetical protein